MSESSLLSALFASAAFDPTQIQAAHGDVQRLPQVLRHPVLEQISRFAEAYRGPLSFGRGLRSPRTFDAQGDAAGLLRLGLTVFFQDLSATLPGALAFLRRFEQELRAPPGSARLSAFASAEDDGVSCHYDAEEVLSVQLIGRKRFFTAPMIQIEQPHGAQYGPGMPVQEGLYAQAGNGFPDASDVQWQVTEMRPGSVMWLPRGTWHRTEALEPSLALSIVIRPPLLLDMLSAWLQPLLVSDLAWRQPLYGIPATEQLQPMLDRLAQRLGCAAPEVLAWQDGGASRWQRWLVVPTSRLEATQVSERLRLQVYALDQQWCHRQTLDTEVPAHLAASLQWLCTQGQAFDLQALCLNAGNAPSGDVLQLLELLVKSHYLRRITLPL